MHFHAATAFSFPAHAFQPSRAFWLGLGAATLIATYDYGGYNNVCLIGEEIRDPNKTIPRAVIYSILLIAILYLAMNLSILGTVPWQQGQYSTAIVADYMQTLYGRSSGVLVSVLILIASWGSVFAILLGYSRIPYAAAVDGHFFKPFARLHPTQKFPSTSLLVVGGISAVACLFHAFGLDLGSHRCPDDDAVWIAVHCRDSVAPQTHCSARQFSDASLSVARDHRVGRMDVHRTKQ